MKRLFIEGFDYYSISEDGKVFSKKLNRYLSPYNNGLGYYQVKLRHSLTKERKSFFVHRLVAICYLENPNNFSDVNHIDGDKSNNCISNLEWVNRHDNMQHAFDNKLLKGFVAKYY
jgi:hypothetical protein